tara:strand:- start:80 stop:340 length:261 start_codon:yes stop_codon:yes gene_type:complete
MARTKMVNGEVIPFTPEEEAARDAEEAKAAEEKAARDADHTWKRKAEYPPVDELIVALWEGVVEERMAAVTKLEAKRQAVKLKYPK